MSLTINSDYRYSTHLHIYWAFRCSAAREDYFTADLPIHHFAACVTLIQQVPCPVEKRTVKKKPSQKCCLQNSIDVSSRVGKLAFKKDSTFEKSILLF